MFRWPKYLKESNVNDKEDKRENEFKVGDVVQLRTGGVKMCVESLGSDSQLSAPRVGWVKCVYWLPSGEPHREEFKTSTLQSPPPDAS